MTKREAIRDFWDSFKGGPKYDLPAFREAWGIYVDNLHRAGMITDKQAHNWEGPASYPKRRGK